MIRIRDTNQIRREKTEMAKQIKFIDLENQKIHGGIEMDDGDVICGCFGGLQKKPRKGLHGKSWRPIPIGLISLRRSAETILKNKGGHIMHINIDRIIKPITLCFILSILTAFLLTTIFYDYDEMVYAGQIEALQDFVGQPAAAVVANYGYPNKMESRRITDGHGFYEERWHYDGKIFTIRFEDFVHIKGIVTGAETITEGELS